MIEMAKAHSYPTLKVTDIEEGKYPKGADKKWPYYLRSAKTAMIFSNDANA